ncbi:MAG: AMP-binding protein [Candidatus Omnitrophota bacterium]|nr:AMP-binding protein [Candidatus Omnitrophota bacterium]
MVIYNLNKNFIDSCRRFSGRIAIEAKKDGRLERITYKDLYKRVNSLAFFLSSLGVRKSDRIAIILENRPEWPVIFFAVSFTGAIAVPIAPSSPHKDISLILSDSGARFAFIPEDNKELREFLKSCKGIEKILTVPLSGMEETGKICEPVSIEQDDLAVLLYTSGTTEAPKGVMLTHKNLCANFHSIEKEKLFSKKDSMLSILPLFHSYALMTTLIVPVFSGLKIIYVAADWPERLGEYVKSSGSSILIGVPQVFSMMHARITRKIQELPGLLKPFKKILIKIGLGSRMRLFVSGGAKLDETVCRDFLKLGIKILEGYGLTETSPVVSINPFRKPRPGSCGMAVDGVEVKIFDKDKDGIGEIAVKGPNIMKGYYRDDAKTKSVFRDGWFLTGDLGYLDEEGYIHINGRSKEVIVLSSGKNIYPEEVERHYLKDPGIKEMCVMGVIKQKGAGNIEALHAVILPDDEYLKGFSQEEARRVFTKKLEASGKDLPSHKRITGFTIIKEKLGRTALGKIKRYEVQKKYMPLIMDEEKKRQRILTQEEEALMKTDIARKVIACLKEGLEINDEINLNDNIQFDLGADSLGMVGLVSAIEKNFNIELDEDIMQQNISTVKDLILRVKELTSQTT